MRKSVRIAKCEEVIIYEEMIGEGVDENPYRILIVVRAKDGTFIAEHDSINDEDNVIPFPRR